MIVRILEGDCRAVMATLPAASVDAIVTDPPYHLTTGKKGGSGPASVNLGTPHGRARVTTGFMGMQWDGGNVAFDVATWTECLRVLKPGGHLLAFSGLRTYHRMVCAIEDAGFEIRDQIMWLYGSGFPKSHNGPWGGTALKPAHEPIVMARKPLIGTVAANVQAHGTGGLNIDGCRVLVAGEQRVAITGRGAVPARHNEHEPRDAGFVAQPHDLGRWPANVLHDGSDEVVAAFPFAGGAAAPVTGNEPTGHGFSGNVYGAPGSQGRQPSNRVDGGGSAARFFYTAKASRFDRNDGTQGMEERMPHPPSGDGRAWDIAGSKSTARANHHPTVKPTDLMRWLVRLVTPKGGTVLDPFMGSGSTLKAAEIEGFHAIGIELDPEYAAIARRRIASDMPLFAEVVA